MKQKILLVDDDALILQTVGGLLKKKGFEVVTAEDGFAAMERVEKENFDLIICDMRMPGINGVETLQKIREYLTKKNRSKMAEIFLTGYAEESLEKKASQMKISRYLYKPFDLKEFLDAVEKALQRG